MADLYLDHNVSRDIVFALHYAGHSVRTAGELGHDRKMDSEHLTIAYQHGWVFVTHNIKDFKLLHDVWRRWSLLWGVNVSHAGILALQPIRPTEMLANLIDQRLSSGAPIAGEMAIWKLDTGWRPEA